MPKERIELVVVGRESFTSTLAARLRYIVPVLFSLGSALAADTPIAGKPVFPYGAVYFRKSNPRTRIGPAIIQTVARAGMNNVPPLVHVVGH